jgi:N-acetylglucosamine-6-phosphate deacetylase
MASLLMARMSEQNESNQRVWITEARLPGYPDPQQLLIDHVLIDHGQIVEIAPMQKAPPLGATHLNLQGDWLSLGGVDVQINGALGLPFPELTPTAANLHKLTEIGELLWRQGVDAYVPTIVTSNTQQVHAALATIDIFLKEAEQYRSAAPQAKLLGVHLEGPFLNPSKRGAHAKEYLQPLTLDTVQTLLGDYAHRVNVITLAPELDPSGATVQYLCQHGITVSLGHSQATAAQAQQAFDGGATMVTHAFNAMPSLHHRQPGLLGAALLDQRVWCGFIADGEHVCPQMLQLLLRTRLGAQQTCPPKLPTGLFLVSDALAPLGLADGVYPWDSRKITIHQGTAHLDDGTLAGTTLSLLTGVQNLVKWQICSPELAIYLATDAPRQAINLPTLGVGAPAHHLLRWRQTSTGELVWQRLSAEDWRQNTIDRA